MLFMNLKTGNIIKPANETVASMMLTSDVYAIVRPTPDIPTPAPVKPITEPKGGKKQGKAEAEQTD